MKTLLVLALAATGWAADVCNPAVVQGPYGFLLSGTTTVSGSRKPIASVGRMVFDGKGGVSGTSSVMFATFLLGNPVTGTYEAHTDCSVTWKLQDDSGNWQHFAGKVTPDGTHIAFRQTDPTGPPSGTMVKSLDACAPATVQRRFRYTMGGAATDWGEIDGSNLNLEDECFVSFPLHDDTFRGIVVDGGKEVLGIRSNPGAPVTIRLQELKTLQ